MNHLEGALFPRLTSQQPISYHITTSSLAQKTPVTNPAAAPKLADLAMHIDKRV